MLQKVFKICCPRHSHRSQGTVQREHIQTLASSATILGPWGKSFDLKSLAFLMCRTWTMWRQPSLSPLMAVGFRDHMHTTRCVQHTRRENAVMGTAHRLCSITWRQRGRRSRCFPGESCSAPCLPFSHA